MKKVLKTIAQIFLILALIFNLYVIAEESSKQKSFLDNLPIALIPVTGSSMEPKISAGDAILVKQVPFHTIKVGDIIVFSRDSELITHEVLEKNATSLVTKGTANETKDYPVSVDEYKAKVICVLPLVGALWRISASPVRFFIFGMLVLLMLFGSDIFGWIYKKLDEGNGYRQNQKGS